MTIRLRAKGRPRRRTPGEMNGLERRYADLLDLRKGRGEIAEWWYECYTFKLARDLRYTVDFVVQLPDGLLECHEVKGYWQDDALAKIKMAAALFPFRFVGVTAKAKKHGGGWEYREF